MQVHITIAVDSANREQLASIGKAFTELAQAADKAGTVATAMAPRLEEGVSSIKEMKVVSEEVKAPEKTPEEIKEEKRLAKNKRDRERRAAKRAEKEAAEKAASVGEEGTEAGSTGTTSEADGTNPTEVTKDTLRELLGEKVKKHRDTLKKEFDKYGVANITQLQDENVPVFYEFLKGLK